MKKKKNCKHNKYALINYLLTKSNYVASLKYNYMQSLK